MKALATVPLLVLATSLGLWGCSGGGSTRPGDGSAAITSARFTITIPAPSTASSRARRAAYVSPATSSVAITLVSVNGAAYSGTPASVTTDVSACTAAPCTYTVIAPAVAGSDVYTIATYNSTGSLLAEATSTLSVISGIANTVTTPLVLGGVVYAIKIQQGVTNLPAGTAASVPLTVAAYDPSDNQIVGSADYLSSSGTALTITLTDTDTSGLTGLTTGTSTSPQTSVSITNPSTVVTLHYTGATPPGGSLTVGIDAAVSGGTIGGTITPGGLTIAP